MDRSTRKWLLGRFEEIIAARPELKQVEVSLCKTRVVLATPLWWVWLGIDPDRDIWRPRSGRSAALIDRVRYQIVYQTPPRGGIGWEEAMVSDGLSLLARALDLPPQLTDITTEEASP